MNNKNCEVANWREREGFSSIVKSTGGGVYVRVRTDSPATPLPKQLTASTTSSNSSMKVVGINKVRKHMDFGPIG